MRKCALFFTLFVITILLAISLPLDNDKLKLYAMSKKKEEKKILIKKDSLTILKKKKEAKRAKWFADYGPE